jgi:hypothetical protein
LLLGLFGLGAATPLVLAAYASRSGLHKPEGNWALAHSGCAAVSACWRWPRAFSSPPVWTRLIATRAIAGLPDAWLELVTRY